MVDRGRKGGWGRWRRYAPTAGSIASHGVIVGALAAMMASSVELHRPAIRSDPQRLLEVMLVSETPPQPMRAPASPPRVAAPDPRKDRVPIAPRLRKDKQAATPTLQDDGVFIPPSILAPSNVPAGLRGAVEGDPCKAKSRVRQPDCVTSWASRLGVIETLMPRSEEDLKRYYAEFMVTCPFQVGCGPNQARMIQLNGAQSVFSRSGAPMMSGAGGLGGISSLTERLQFDPDHRDPGFGD